VELLPLSLAVIVLIAINAFFVLTEFAIVRVRPSRVTELVARGVRGSSTLVLVQRALDEHLGVCQIGITFASVALGVASQRIAELISGHGAQPTLSYVTAIALTYFVVTGSHIVLGEMLPKAVAIRIADGVALRCAVPLRAVRVLFYPLLWLFTAVAMAVARVLRLPRATDQEKHTEEELRIILEQFQERGQISFRRLLFMENVFELGSLRVRDAMRPRTQVRVLRADASWEQNLEVIEHGRFIRYPVVAGPVDGGRPTGFVHLKDAVIRRGPGDTDLAVLSRPLLEASEDAPLEALLGDMQRKRVHAALAFDSRGEWTGFITVEDIIEEIIGTIRDEFEGNAPACLADALTVDRIYLDIEAPSLVDAVRVALARTPRAKLPFPGEWIALAVDERERTAGTYMGNGIAIPHARLADLASPFAMILRSREGIPCVGTTERAYLLFVLLTPAGQPRVHQALLQIIAMLLHENPYIYERLRTVARAEDVLDIVRSGEQASRDSKLPQPNP
jgi:CBS domain containing-hemolysin-like protein/mannitol/fructose-specific phosphotransferase system IIA component (Ntr-type)